MTEVISRILDIYTLFIYKNFTIRKKNQLFSIENNDGI